MVVPLRSQVRLRLSRLSVQHGRSASSHRPALTLARCSVAAHCALLRVLATSALRASDVRKLTRGFPCLTGVFVPACASLARYSGAAERFALFLNSAWSYHCARKLACGTPCFIGLTTACFAHCARPPCAPRPSTPSGLRRLRPVSRTARGLRAPPLHKGD